MRKEDYWSQQTFSTIFFLRAKFPFRFSFLFQSFSLRHHHNTIDPIKVLLQKNNNKRIGNDTMCPHFLIRHMGTILVKIFVRNGLDTHSKFSSLTGHSVQGSLCVRKIKWKKEMKMVG